MGVVDKWEVYKSYHQWVFINDPKEFNTSATLSPAITLDPRNSTYDKRRKALTSLVKQVNDFPLAKRAVEWVADYDPEITLMQIARRALGLVPYVGKDGYHR